LEKFRLNNTQDVPQTPPTYTIKLPQFEGPFDLLLFFIERDELDIHDIPIAKITDDFLEYIRTMESLNIDLASEFILVAATLMRIKAKMLLPRKELDEEGNEIDPRNELVERLLEYKRYKSVLDELRKMEKERSSRHERGNISHELKKIATQALVDIELESVTLYKLLNAFERVMQRFEDRTATRQVHKIVQYSYTVEHQQQYIVSQLKKGQKTGFSRLFRICENRIHAIVTFLALLELLNRQEVHLVQGVGINNFWVTLP
jgi:segregation and condensation protein A